MLQPSKRQQQQQQTRNQSHHNHLTHISVVQLVVTIIICSIRTQVNAGVFYPRGGSFGYLAAVAIPLDLPNRNVYMAFNFESNYGLPSNDSYNEWIDRWDLDENYLSIGNNVTAINGRRMEERKKRSSRPRFDRRSFYRTFTGYLDHYAMNGTGCLLRTICEVAASTMEENNGVLGSILKIIFMPTTSRPETRLHNNLNDQDLYRAEWQGRNYLANTMNQRESKNSGSNIVGDNEGAGDGGMKEDDDADGYGNGNGNGNGDDDGDVSNACLDYTRWCPEGVINMISAWY